MRRSFLAFLVFLALTPVLCPGADGVFMPDGSKGIDFDDIVFSRETGKVLVPSGKTGKLNLIDPGTRQITTIGGFDNTTSSDQGRGWVFAADRGRKTLDIVDPAGQKIVFSTPLASGPDYVRYVNASGEVWVTEPDNERVEVFTFSTADKPVLTHASFISVPGGPESLVIDNVRQRAYTNLWKGETLAIDIKTHAVAARWPNGCEAPRGLALDENRGFLFVGAKEGKAVVLDVNNGGKSLSVILSGSGVDIIAYSPELSHLYIPSGKNAAMAIVEVSQEGKLSLLSVVSTARGSRYAAADDRGNVWVPDPDHGQLLVFHDEQRTAP